MDNPLYLFCFARSDLIPSLEGKGLSDQEPLFVLSFPEIAAVVCPVNAEDFCGPEAESRMQDLTWVGPRACRHEEVVEEVMRYSPVLPVGLGTIFVSPESLEKRVHAHHRAIREFLNQAMDKEEWAVKGFLDRARAKEEFLAGLRVREEARLSTLSPGKRYFQEQRLLAAVEKDLSGWLKEACQGIVDELHPIVSAFCERKILSRRSTGREEEVVVNWAFWVDRNAVGDFRGKIDRANIEHARRGLVFELSGPWPPYSFSPSLEPETEA